jgi:predicted dienelactone hydrolase
MQHEILMLYDRERPSWAGDGPRPVRTHVWRPAGSDDLRGTVVVSHGTGGAASQMTWLTEPLATAGYLTIAVDHHGNNFVDGYLAEGFVRWWERPLDFRVVLDELGERESIGTVGAAGFSLGGYTVAALLGARVDAAGYAALFSGEIPAPPPPEYPTLEDELRARLTEADIAAWIAESAVDSSDDRVRAGFLVCPAIGRMLDHESLAAIDRPVEIRSAGADDITATEDNADVYAGAIPGAEIRSVGPAVGHYAFVSDNPEFVEVRERVAREAVAFFEQRLPPA